MTDQPRFDQDHLRLGRSSFLDFARRAAPDEITTRLGAAVQVPSEQPHATTIVAVRYRGGAVMVGDRRATSGTYIAHREIEKVFPADSSSVIGIAGAAGIGIDLVRLFQLELEHYEKIESTALSLEGKANRLAHLVRANLELASRGLIALPLFAGYDAASEGARLFSYDVVGGRYAERDYHAIGSGSVFAKGTLKNRYRAELESAAAIVLAVRALLDAAEDDSATAGADVERGIYPVVAVVDGAGYRRLPDSETAAAVHEVLRHRATAGENQR